jgi:hypothetical protein
MRDALRAALALAPAPNGFTVAEFTAQVHALTGHDHTGYSVRQAAYDLRNCAANTSLTGQAEPAATTSGHPPHAPSPPCSPSVTRSSPDPRRGAQPPHRTQTRALDVRCPGAALPAPASRSGLPNERCTPMSVPSGPKAAPPLMN